MQEFIQLYYTNEAAYGLTAIWMGIIMIVVGAVFWHRTRLDRVYRGMAWVLLIDAGIYCLGGAWWLWRNASMLSSAFDANVPQAISPIDSLNIIFIGIPALVWIITMIIGIVLVKKNKHISEARQSYGVGVCLISMGLIGCVMVGSQVYRQISYSGQAEHHAQMEMPSDLK